MIVRAPAKINLTLEALGKRPDGYHEIRSVAQAIGLYDVFHFKANPTLEYQCSYPEWRAQDSLVSKAAKLLQETTKTERGARIDIDKRIPFISGLGGDSSDAAATLIGLNQLWKLDLPRSELHELASKLGSDVPFFLYGGTALLEGRGVQVMPLPSLPHMWCIVIVPEVSRQAGKTLRLYNSLRPGHFTDGQFSHHLVEWLKTGGEFEPSLLYNTFENVPFAMSMLDIYWQKIIKLGAQFVHLAGSGPALYTLVWEKAAAQKLYNRILEAKLKAYLVETLEAKEN